MQSTAQSSWCSNQGTNTISLAQKPDTIMPAEEHNSKGKDAEARNSGTARKLTRTFTDMATSLVLGSWCAWRHSRLLMLYNGTATHM